jgi:hypothetical protein
MKTFLVILFMVNGQPTIMVNGFSPIAVDADVCEQRIEYVRDYIPTVPNLPEIYDVVCGTQEELQEQFNIEFNSVPT